MITETNERRAKHFTVLYINTIQSINKPEKQRSFQVYL